MYCRTCGKQLHTQDRVCAFCGTPVRTALSSANTAQPTARRNLRVTRVAAPTRAEQTTAAPAPEIAFVGAKRRRREDVLFGVAVAVLVLMALATATLCVLLLTRGPDPEHWFEKRTAQTEPAQTAALPTPVGTAITASPRPTPSPSPTPTAVPTATPTPAPTSAAEGKTALAELLLEGIERDYTKDELEDFSEYELSILRNGMYAYSGLSFRKSQYKDFFGDCDWYAPNTDDDEKVYKRFNSHQKKNVATILSMEKEKGYR